MKSLIFITLVLLVGCGKKPETRNKDVGVYISNFYSIAKDYKGIIIAREDIDFEFGNLDHAHNVVATCTYSFPRRKITLDKAWWNSEGISDTLRDNIIKHELGHCALSRDHVDTAITSNGSQIPSSIMNPSTINPDVYKANYSYYVSELLDETLSTSNSVPQQNIKISAITADKYGRIGCLE